MLNIEWNQRHTELPPELLLMNRYGCRTTAAAAGVNCDRCGGRMGPTYLLGVSGRVDQRHWPVRSESTEDAANVGIDHKLTFIGPAPKSIDPLLLEAAQA